MAAETVTFNLDKNKDFSEWFSKIIEVAELADLRNDVKGFVVFRPWAVRCMKQMYRLYEKALERKGHWPALFPALIPERLLKIEKDHVEGFAPQVFWVDKAGDGELPERHFMRPTSETPMYQMYSIWVRSWRDLPLKIYQSCQVWRYETKATRPFIRSREFWWIEAHDVFATKEDSVAQVREDMETTEEVMHQQFGVPFIFFRRPEWDKFPGAEDTFAADTLMPDGRVLQQPSTHLLGQKFSKPFGITFKDKDEKDKIAWQTCYGPAISRIIASVFAFHGDNKGLVFPYNIAPLQVIIVPILAKEPDKVLNKAIQLKDMLEKNDIRSDIDDSDKRPGEKYYFWEMKGVPVRLELGLREMEQAKLTLSRRDTGEKVQIYEKDLITKLEEMGAQIVKNLREKADKDFQGRIQEASSMEELKQKLEAGGFVKVPFCSREMAGRECADQLKSDTGGGDVRGTTPFKEEDVKGDCVVCGKPATSIVYVGKSY